MRRSTRYRLLALKELILRVIPIVAVAAAGAALVWGVLIWPKKHYPRPETVPAISEELAEELPLIP